MAHKLARLVYIMLTQRQDYVDAGHDCFEERLSAREMRSLKHRAQQTGMVLMPAEQPV